MEQTMQEALSSADAAITYAARIETVIDNDVAGLAPLIEARLESERAYRRLQCAAAIGMSADGLETARKVAAGAASALAEASLRLGGFRAARGDHGPVLCASFDQLKRQLPQHEAQIRADFESEWSAAAAKFSVMRARRAGIEKLLNAKMDLTEPLIAPTPAGDLADIGIPGQKLAELQERIARIDVMRSAAVSVDNNRVYVLQGQSLLPYAPDGIFVVTDSAGFDGLPFLAKIVDSSFDRGRTEFAVAFGYARPVESTVEPGVEMAAKKAKQIEREEREARAQREQREALERAGFVPQKSRRLDLEQLDKRFEDPAAAAKDATDIEEASEERKVEMARFSAEQEYADKRNARVDKEAAERAKIRQPERPEPAKKEWPENALL